VEESRRNLHNKHLQITNKNLDALLKNRINEADSIVQKLEEKLGQIVNGNAKSSEFEEKVKGSLKVIEGDVKVLLTKAPSVTSAASSAGLSEADRTFLKELTNETKDAIQDMRLEVLTASDKSKLQN